MGGMAAMNVFKTTTSVDSPLDGSTGDKMKPGISEFLTIQSLANFAAMTGAITAAWHSLQTVIPEASALWVPYAFALFWGIVSLLISLDGLKTGSASPRHEAGTIVGAIFVAVINSLVLAGAVVGTAVATGEAR